MKSFLLCAQFWLAEKTRFLMDYPMSGRAASWMLSDRVGWA